MQPTSPDVNSSSLDTPDAFARGRGSHRVALAVVLALHAVLLACALLSRWHTPTPPKHERSTDVVVELPPQKKIVEPPPEAPKAPELAAPPPITPVVPELPKLEFKPDAIVAPSPAPPPPAVVTAPAEGANTTKSAPVPVPAAPPVAVAAPAPGSTKLFAECADTPDRRMVADVYQLRRDTQTVKAMDKRKPVKRVCMSQLDVEPSDFKEGFPGMNMIEWFGLDIRFTITIAKTGNWDFMIMSDDGSRVSIDDVEIINNDGLHNAHAVMETVTLTQGVHNVRVRYFQGLAPGFALMLGWKKEGAKDWVLIPQSIIGRPPAELLPPLTAPAN